MPKSPFIDLEACSVPQLNKMLADIPSVIERKTAERQTQVRDELQRMAKGKGFDAYKLFERSAQPAKNGVHTPVVAKKASKVRIKYRDPKNPENTWTGRGMSPRWLVAAEKGGAKRDSFLVA